MLLKADHRHLYPVAFNRIRERFLAYVATFMDSDSTCRAHILLKRNHSLRVSSLAGLIGRRIHLDSGDITLAKIIGLLHDAGRFEQFARYRTFNDHVSIDHGSYGAELLEDLPMLLDLDAETRDIIRCAVAHHNKAALPPGLDARRHLHGRLIRDADKLDILKVLTDDLNQQTYHFIGPIKNPDVSPELLENLRQKRVIRYQDVKSDADAILIKLAWVYDFNFAPALAILRRRDYLSTFKGLLPQTRDLQAAFQQIDTHIDEALKRQGQDYTVLGMLL